jgi:hypothetical protein
MADKVEHRDTSCFTYEVTMVVQILASNKEEADQKLEMEGGFVSHREVLFKDCVSVFSGEGTSEKTQDTAKE